MYGLFVCFNTLTIRFCSVWELETSGSGKRGNIEKVFGSITAEIVTLAPARGMHHG